MPSKTASLKNAAAPGRQRPEDILAHTLSAPPHPEATAEWSPRGRRLFFLALAVAGVVLVAAGLLITGELAPGPGNPTPLQSGPGNGLADQLLRPVTDNGPPTTAPAGVLVPGSAANQPAANITGSPGTPLDVSSPSSMPTTKDTHSTTTTTPRSPTTTLPCGLLGQGLQSAQVQLPCRAPTGSPLG